MLPAIDPRRSLLLVVVVAVALAFAATEASARRPIRKDFFDAYPSAVGSRLDDLTSNASHCGVCHLDFDGGGARNAYGLAVEVARNSGNFADGIEAILSLDGLDSDNDGAANGIEITELVDYTNTPTFPGLKASTLAQTLNVDQSEIQDYLTPVGGADPNPPVVTMIAPVGGESIPAETVYTVQWTATDDVDVTHVDLYLSDDGGIEFKPVAVNLANTGTYDWFVPHLPGPNTLFRVEAHDPAGNEGHGTSTDFEIQRVARGVAPTSLRDFELPGTQPHQGGIYDDPEANCRTCHGDYDTAVEPYYSWKGTPMGNAARDPLFLATLVVAEQDAPSVGDLCIRCHSPGGWQEGRSTDTYGGLLTRKDRESVQCDYCHRLVDPVYEVGVSPVVDEEILAEYDELPLQPANGQWIADPDPIRRGPYADAVASHQFIESPFHREAAICATCHDVSNPVFEAAGDLSTYVPGPLDAPHVDFDLRNMFPIERTSSEWGASEYASTGVYAPQFAGDKPDGIVSTCQDCHMPDVTGLGANQPNTPTRSDLPHHDMMGGNYFIPPIIAEWFPDETDAVALAAAADRAVLMLQKAATLDLVSSPQAGQLGVTVTVTNETGHKLPSGYPEGRRIWLRVRGYDETDALVYESGAYDQATGVLTKDADAKIYEIKPGISTRLAGLLGLTSGPSFHFALNDTVYSDNRIPPRGFTQAAFEAIQSPPVAYTYADGQYADATTYTLPSTVRRVTAELLYQTTSKEYVEFLRDENVTDDTGQRMYDSWVAHDRAAPVTMASGEITLDATAAPSIPSVKTALGAAVPNPFNPRTEIVFSIGRDQRASLRVFDARGRLVRTLADGALPSGVYRAPWDGTDRAGRAMASGIYFVELSSEDGRWTRKVSLVR